MTDHITLTGLVATEPKHILTSEGLAITNFRLASTQRKFDKANGKWVDGDTNWYTITAFRQLALNVSASVKRGERVIVSGRLKVRSWDNGERSGMNVDVEVDAVGHDLSWGTSAYSRNMSVSSAADADAGADPGTAGASTESAEQATARPVEQWATSAPPTQDALTGEDSTSAPF
jgi:single-strand DNA-binding protein